MRVGLRKIYEAQARRPSLGPSKAQARKPSRRICEESTKPEHTSRAEESHEAPVIRMVFNLHDRLGHPRREWKPEFKLGRYPPLDVTSCSLSRFDGCRFGSGPGPPESVRRNYLNDRDSNQWRLHWDPTKPSAETPCGEKEDPQWRLPNANKSTHGSSSCCSQQPMHQLPNPILPVLRRSGYTAQDLGGLQRNRGSKSSERKAVKEYPIAWMRQLDLPEYRIWSWPRRYNSTGRQ
jgi:hypothetical protein